jgi:hypothetical protein
MNCHKRQTKDVVIHIEEVNARYGRCYHHILDVMRQFVYGALTIILQEIIRRLQTITLDSRIRTTETIEEATP